MEYYSPGAPSSFPGLQASGTTDPSGEAVLLSLPWREEWHPRHGAPSAPSVAMETGSEEAVWRMTLQTRDGMDAPQHPYPERPGEPDCAYYMRTGLCGFGMGCRFNHPSNRRLAAAATRNRGELPERIGQPECQYYLKTGSCKFGATCKYHHPQDKAAYAARARLNMLNLPLRPGERDCSYYMRMRTCKYGVTCKFNHPEPEPAIGTLVSMQGSGQLFQGGSGSSPAAQPYPAGLQAWSITGAPYLASPRLPGPSNFASVLLSPHQSLIPMPAWSAYQGHGLPLPSPDRQQQALRANYVYGAAAQQDPVAFHHGSQAAFPAYMPGAGQLPTPPSPSTSGSKEKVYYPERPGQPECQYYMRTGDCKFGLTCRYHHPRDRNASSSALVLSPMGLPLRPGAPPCTFYTRHGYCRFGPTCKFDHPFVALPYSPSAPPLGDVSVASLSTGSSPTILAPPTETPIQLIRHSATAGSSIEPTSSSSGPQASHRQSSSRGSLEEEDMPSRRIDSIEGENIAAQGSTVGAPLSSGTASSPEIHGVL